MEQEEEYKVSDVADLYWENVMMIKEIKKYKTAMRLYIRYNNGREIGKLYIWK